MAFDSTRTEADCNADLKALANAFHDLGTEKGEQLAEILFKAHDASTGGLTAGGKDDAVLEIDVALSFIVEDAA